MTTTTNNPVYFLLVDDLDENLLALEGLLRREGLTLLLAHSAVEDSELLLKQDIVLALVDIQMPGMDGFELAELMWGNRTNTASADHFATAGIHPEATFSRV